MELIQQGAEHEALDICGLTMFVLGTIARLCTPVQDEEVQGLQSLPDPAQLLREIFRVLGLMKMDMLIFTIQSIRTNLQDHTIQYERKKFQELLDKLPSRYEAALEDISDQVLQEVSRTLVRLGYPTFTTDKCASLKGQIKSIMDKGNAVWHVTEQWIHSFLSLFISPDGQNSQKDFPKGLDPIQEELLEVGRRFGSMIHHNRQVFGPYYSGILKKLLLPNAEPESDAGMDSF